MSYGKATIQLIGNVVRKPEMKEVGTQRVATFSVAINERRKGKEDAVSYFEVSAFGNLAGIAESYLDAGRMVAIDGTIRHRKWRKTDGSWGSSVEVIPSDLLFLNSPKSKAAEEERGGDDPSIPW